MTVLYSNFNKLKKTKSGSTTEVSTTATISTTKVEMERIESHNSQ